jgi:hypothetical protein
MSTSLQKLSESNVQMLSEMENLKAAMIRQMFMQNEQGDIYVKKTGLLMKLEQKFGKGNYSTRVEVPSKEEYELIRSMTGLPVNEPVAIFRGVVQVGNETFVDYAAAHKYNCFGRTTNLVELSGSRALLRAVRQATNMGFCSVEEVGVEDNISPPSTTTTTITEPATKEQRDAYLSLCKDLNFTRENPGNLNQLIKQALNREIGSTKNCSRQEMDAILTVLNNELKRKGGVVKEKTEEVKEKEIKETREIEKEKEEKEEIIEGVVISSEEVKGEEENKEINKETKNKKEDNK